MHGAGVEREREHGTPGKGRKFSLGRKGRKGHRSLNFLLRTRVIKDFQTEKGCM